MIGQRTILTPIGDITITEVDDAIVSLDWGTGRDQSNSPLLSEAANQIHAYFDGARPMFDLPLNPPVTAFVGRVLSAMQTISYGETKTYGAIAQAIGSSARAVGGACGRNPIPILIPCHRVLASQGLGGYSGGDGLDTKRALLRLEGANKT